MTDGHIYLIVCPEIGMAKIGYSSEDPSSRLANLRTATPFDLDLVTKFPGTKATEKAIHKAFSDLHVRREWFREIGTLEYVLDEMRDLFWGDERSSSKILPVHEIGSIIREFREEHASIRNRWGGMDVAPIKFLRQGA